MNPLTALLLGFTFSFAWTPCVGPALTSVLLMAGSAATRGMGFVLIGVYTLGFILPFLAVGMFTSQVLGFSSGTPIGSAGRPRPRGVLLIVMGLMMFTGWMNGFTGYLSGLGGAGGGLAQAKRPGAHRGPPPRQRGCREAGASSQAGSSAGSRRPRAAVRPPSFPLRRISPWWTRTAKATPCPTTRARWCS